MFFLKERSRKAPSWLGGKHGKIYSKCMGKIGSLMLDNLRYESLIVARVKFEPESSSSHESSSNQVKFSFFF